jgi:hypothetical protein
VDGPLAACKLVKKNRAYQVSLGDLMTAIAAIALLLVLSRFQAGLIWGIPLAASGIVLVVTRGAAWKSIAIGACLGLLLGAAMAGMLIMNRRSLNLGDWLAILSMGAVLMAAMGAGLGAAQHGKTVWSWLALLLAAFWSTLFGALLWSG